MKRLQARMTSGIVVLVPVVVTLYVLRLIFMFTVGAVLPWLGETVGHWPWIGRAALSAGIVLGLVYVLGSLATHVVGRRLLEMGERLLLQVPLVGLIYRSSKQVVEAFRRGESRPFRSVVFVEFPHPGMKAVGFLTGSMVRPDGSRWNTVFIPTTPNPTTGFLQVVPDAAVEATDLTTEEAFKMILSLGALAPDREGAAATSRDLG